MKTKSHRASSPRKRAPGHDVIYRRLAIHLRWLREKHGLSLSDLSHVSGVGVSTLSLIESGKARCSLDTLILLAPKLHTTAPDVLRYALQGHKTRKQT